ncbi:MAG: hypothetical protein JWO77_1647 [Ilumatobacteraceae bacterium]|nr:hypothetical protein [Ilumatobacteraceae bacterium]
MQRERLGSLLVPLAIVCLVFLIVGAVFISRLDEHEGPSTKQRRAYEDCMEPYLPPLYEDDPGRLPDPTVSTSTAPPAELRRCHRLLDD